MYNLLLMADPNLTTIKQYIPNALVLLAFSCQNDSEQLIGIAVLTSSENKVKELKNIAIAEEYQGKGYAKQLIKAAKQQAKTQGANQLTVGTGNSSLSQLALYQKCGFRLSHVVKDFFKTYPEPIFENDIQCIDMVMLSCELDDKDNSE